MEAKNHSSFQSGHSQDVSINPLQQSFQFQLECLKLEVETINQTIERIDNTTNTFKSLSFTIWITIVSLVIANNYKSYILMTLLIPLAFWYLDARWRRLQRQFIFRSRKIAEFVNSPRLTESFTQNRLVDFNVMDPRGVQYKNNQEYQKFASIWQTARFRSVSTFYLIIIALTLIIGIFSLLAS